MIRMLLTDASIRHIKPATKSVKLYDKDGLYLLANPNGAKWWRFKYRFDGKEKLLSLGVYPDVGLKCARQRRDEARRLLAQGIDPAANRKAEKHAAAQRAAHSFEATAMEWLAKHEPRWSKAHTHKILSRLARNVFPWIGDKPITAITPPDVLSVLRKIESRNAIETAHRVLQYCTQIFRYAIATGRTKHNPASDLKEALPPAQRTHFAAITHPARLGQLLRAIDDYPGYFVTQCALRLAPLLFVRPGELRRAAWDEINLDKAEWRYLVTKTQTEHLVPLARQAVTILQKLHETTGSRHFVFPCVRSSEKPLSENALGNALKKIGFGNEQNVHGFRATARTLLDEELGIRPDYIEHQLAHTVRDPNGRAYNRTAHLAERQKMMQQWADYLDGLKTA
jgi:integrase